MKSASRNCGDKDTCKLRHYFVSTDSKLNDDELGVALSEAVYVAKSFSGRAVTLFFSTDAVN